MALKEIIVGMVIDLQFKVEQADCKKPLDISDINIASSKIEWQKPTGVILVTGLALVNTGVDGLFDYKMSNPPVGTDTLVFDEPGIWKVKYELTMNTSHVLKNLEVIELEVKKEAF